MNKILFGPGRVAGLALGLSLVVCLPARPAVLAYEGFNYSPGSVAGQNGGFGWNGGWLDVGGGGGLSVSVGSLTAGGSAPSGFDARSAGNSLFVGANNRAGRWLDCTTNGNFAQAGYLDANGNIGAAGKSLYVSFLQQPGSTAQFYEFEFHRANLGDPGRIGGIGNDLVNATTVNLRAPNSVQTPLGLGNTNVNFYIVRIDFHGGSDDVYVYRNPTRPLEASNAPVLTMPGAADMSFNGLSMAAYLNGVTVRHDEIRLGESWTDVLGNPPVFVVQPTNQNVYVGQSATLAAVAQSTQPVTYQWYFGTNALTGQTSSNLTLVNLHLTDAGQYSAVASNGLGVATSPVAALNVQIMGIAIPCQSLLVGAGSNLTINAAVSGAPPMSLQWFKNGLPVAGATNAAYSVAGASVFDAGQYVLVANNSYGSATGAVVNVFPNFGGLLAYEGFDYSPGNNDIGGANGGFGWAGAWVNVNGGSSQSLSNSLLAATNAPAGYDSHSINGSLYQPNASRKGRFLDCSAAGIFAAHGYLDANGNIGADGKTLYVSFLQQPSAVVQFYEFELKRGDLGDGGRLGGIGNDTGDQDAHLRAEVPPGGGSTFWDLGPGSTNVNFYVLRIDFKPGNDDVFVYRNPASLTEPATPTLTVSNIADMSFNGISFGAYLNNVAVSHDEVRLGMTWSDVVGQDVSWLQMAQHSGSASSVRLAASPNFLYELQSAARVTGPWTNIASVAIPTGGIGEITDTNAIDPQRFYRAMNGATASAFASGDLLIADFEGSTYGNWVTTGTAFGSGPAHGTLPNQQTVSGYQGSGFVDSYNGGDASVGSLMSPPFVITKPYLDFLIGGGDYPGQECINLIVTNAIVRTATGANSETLMPAQWDVSAYLGQTATLQILDLATGSWGHIDIDEITLSDLAFPALSRQIVITNNLLNLPVKNGSTMRRVTVTVGGNPVRDFNIELADGAPDWWAFVDVSAFQGQAATITVNGLGPNSAGLSSIVQTNGIVGATNLYSETLRPQVHFSTRRGWLNDANGMFFHQGQYHLYYQHDPFNWDGSGQKWWGHAASPDMIHWTELPEGIYSHTYGDDVWSGSAVVDAANTSGFKTGTNDVIVAAFYSTARGECIDYSNDGGLTFSEYSNNPVVVHATTGRDPHLLWYAPSNYWVMAVYDATGGNGISIYSAPDLKHWTYRSKIFGFFECPDLFQLPVDGNTNNLQWVLCDASSGYMIGQFDGATFTPSTAKLPGNLGSGFYASQTFTSLPPGDARKVRIGWAQVSMPGMPFNQMMFFPTTLTLNTVGSAVQLCSQPVAEMTNAVLNSYSWTNLALNPGCNPLSGIRGGFFDVQAHFAPGSAQSINFVLCGVPVTYSPSAQQISCNGDTQSLPPVNGTVNLEILFDRQAVEIFGNGGQLYMPIANTYYSPTNNVLSLTSQGAPTSFNWLIVNQLDSTWTGAIQ